MYTCQICGKTVPPRTKANHVVLATRPRHYPKREKVNRFRHDSKIVYTDDSGGQGREIVREVIACPHCATTQPSAVDKP